MFHSLQTKHLLIAAIGLEGLGGILFIFGSSLGAYLLVRVRKFVSVQQCNLSMSGGYVKGLMLAWWMKAMEEDCCTFLVVHSAYVLQ